MSDIPLSLYIHFPWCVRKCPYCDFNSHEADDIPESAYVERLIADLAVEANQESRSSLVSIFMGGGTPSLFKPESINKVLSAVRDHFEIESAEITMEANPGTFDQGHFQGYADAGVNRLSIGAQSFSNEALAKLGRIHQSNDIARAVAGTTDAGIGRFNIDLMHGLPNQSGANALADLARASDLNAEHISWYQLTIEPNTVFYNRPPVLPEENILEDINSRGAAFLLAQGYARYEISAWSKPGSEARHNLNYWQFGDYIGIGAGAHGKLTRTDGVYRTNKTRLPKDYLAGGSAKHTQVPAQELPLEFLMNALRLTGGFGIGLYQKRTGLEAATLDRFLDQAERQALITFDDTTVQPTAKGLQYLDSLLMLVD